MTLSYQIFILVKTHPSLLNILINRSYVRGNLNYDLKLVYSWKEKKTNVVWNSSPTIGSITQKHYRSFAIVLIFSCLGQSKSPGFHGVFYLLVDFTTPFNSLVNGRKVSQWLVKTFTTKQVPQFNVQIMQKPLAKLFTNH